MYRDVGGRRAELGLAVLVELNGHAGGEDKLEHVGDVVVIAREGLQRGKARESRDGKGVACGELVDETAEGHNNGVVRTCTLKFLEVPGGQTYEKRLDVGERGPAVDEDDVAGVQMVEWEARAVKVCQCL